jgi:DNA-binding CsgD family transcriptional regulator
MCQVAYLELVETVERIWLGEIELYNNQIVKVISKNIEYRCRDYKSRRKIVSANYNTLRMKLRKGINNKDLLIPEFESMSEEAKAILRLLPPQQQIEMIDIANKEDLIMLKKLVKSKIYKTITPGDQKELEISVEPHTEKMMELLHAINTCIHNTTEYWIIELRKEGYTYQEIGNRIKLSAMQVGYYVNQVKERFEKLYEDRLK